MGAHFDKLCRCWLYRDAYFNLNLCSTVRVYVRRTSYARRDPHRCSERCWTFDNHLFCGPTKKQTVFLLLLISFLARFFVCILSSPGKADIVLSRQMELPCSNRQACCQPGDYTQRWQDWKTVSNPRGMSCVLDPASVQVLRVGKLPSDRRDDGMCAVLVLL